MLGIETEVVIFFYAALTGMVLFCGYQILLLIRRLVRHHRWRRCGGYRLLAVGERICVSSDVLYDLWKYPLVLCSGNRSRAADCCGGAAFVETNFQEIEKNIKNKEILIKTAE